MERCVLEVVYKDALYVRCNEWKLWKLRVDLPNKKSFITAYLKHFPKVHIITTTILHGECYKQQRKSQSLNTAHRMRQSLVLLFLLSSPTCQLNKLCLNISHRITCAWVPSRAYIFLEFLTRLLISWYSFYTLFNKICNQGQLNTCIYERGTSN